MRPAGSRLAALLQALAFASGLAVLAGCQSTAVAPYDPPAVQRLEVISTLVLESYQALLARDEPARPAALQGDGGSSDGEIETLIRVHLLREQARFGNAEGSRIAERLLESWTVFSASHRSGRRTTLSDATLMVERGILERHLAAAFKAEEARRLGINTTAENE